MSNNNLLRPLHQLLLFFCAVALMLCVPARAGSVSATAYSKTGELMSDVVVFATPLGLAVPPAGKADTAVIAQQQMQFTPYVTVLRVGTEVKFPNYDKIEHHVKSFSPAKEFEIKPYQKITPPPVMFDKTGIIVVYCLFHEWMRAYVLVVDTPYFGKSEAAGVVDLNNLPEGKYEIRAWHPDMGYIKPPLLQTLNVTATGTQQIRFNFDFNPKKRKSAKVEPVADAG